MTAIPLTSGAYQAQSQIANAQRCVNLYPEFNPEKTRPAMPVTHYPRPGLLILCSPVSESGVAPIPSVNPFLANETGDKVLTSETGIPLTPP